MNKKIKEVAEKWENNGVFLEYPQELGHRCPICKNKSGLTWSEYKWFEWCKKCERDIPIVLCIPDVDKAINHFLILYEKLKNN